MFVSMARSSTMEKKKKNRIVKLAGNWFHFHRRYFPFLYFADIVHDIKKSAIVNYS